MRFIDVPFYARQIVVVSLILAFVLAIIGLFTAVRLCKKPTLIVFSSVTFALSFVSVFLTMRGSYRYRVGLSVFEPSLSVISLPFFLHCALSAVLFVFAVSSIVYAVFWNKKHLSPVSIKESADKLPAGICFYEKSGLVRFVNAEMNGLCVVLTGRALLNGESFWQKISRGETDKNCLLLQNGDNPIVKYKDGKVTSFKRYEHEIDGKIFYEIVAVDVTERYRLTRELEQKQGELKSVNKRLVAYGDKVAELTKEKELLSAKIRIHDDMGRLLLATKKRLSEPLENQDKKELLRFWQTETDSIKSTRAKPKKNGLQVIEDVAELVGVKIIFTGTRPEADTAEEKILASAMHECLTNTVSHANGKTMTVTATEKDGKYIITITNDGKKPKGEITEGGGLSGLRTLVGRENGRMTVESNPRFELTIELPKGEKL